jgi:hypothetical protein
MNGETNSTSCCSGDKTNRNDIARIAYGILGATEDDVYEARHNLIESAIAPTDFVEAYFLIYLDANLEEIFFERIRTINFSKEEWKIILDKSKSFGLRNLESYAEIILEQLCEIKQSFV